MRRLQGLGFAVFCLVSGSRWLVDSAYPGVLPVLPQQALHYGVIAVLASGIGVLHAPHSRRKSVPRSWWQLALASVLLLGLPVLLQEAAHTVTEQDGAALFALVPLCVVVAMAAYGRAPTERESMMPALIGLAGALLLLPFQLPSTGYGGWLFAVLLAAILLTAAASVWLHGVLQGWGIPRAVTLFSLGNALVLGLAAVPGGSLQFTTHDLLVEMLRCVALDLPQMFLLVWLLRDLAPVRLSARYLVAPWLTAVEGLVFLHPVIDLRIALGLLLMAVGAVALLFQRVGEENPGSLKLGAD